MLFTGVFIKFVEKTFIYIDHLNLDEGMVGDVIPQTLKGEVEAVNIPCNPRFHT